MANERNLKPFGKERKPLSHEEAVSKGKKGGKASGKARLEKKTLREALKALLGGSYTIDGINGQKLETDGYTAIALAAIQQALGGSVQAFKEIRDTIGEKPSDKVDLKGDVKFNSGGLKETLKELKRKD